MIDFLNPKSPLHKKVLQFCAIFIFVQSIPILVDPIISLVSTSPVPRKPIERVDLITVLILSGSAWLSIPAYIDKFDWSKNKATELRKIATIFGVSVIVISAFLKAIQSSGSVIKPGLGENITIGLFFLLAAVIFIIYSHNKLLRLISVRLLWKHQSQFAGIYSAKENGIYESRGLKVNVHSADISLNSVYAFDGSDDDFAIVAGMDVIRMRDKNQKVRSILPIVSVNPFTVIAHDTGDISSITDLKGKRVAIQVGYETEIYFRELLKVFGLSLDNDFEQVIAGYDYSLFYEKKVDIWLGYDGHEPQLFRRKKYQ